MSKRSYIYGDRPVPLKIVHEVVATRGTHKDSMWVAQIFKKNGSTLYRTARTSPDGALSAALNGAGLDRADFVESYRSSTSIVLKKR